MPNALQLAQGKNKGCSVCSCWAAHPLVDYRSETLQQQAAAGSSRCAQGPGSSQPGVLEGHPRRQRRNAAFVAFKQQ